MKKLKLDGIQAMSKEQMKKINGGYGACGALNWAECSCLTATSWTWDLLEDECDEEYGGLSHTYDYFVNQMRSMCLYYGGEFTCNLV